MNCQRCGKKLGCGCQKRVASDGTQGCNSCTPAYEINLNNKKQTSVEPLMQLNTDVEKQLSEAPKDYLNHNGNINPTIVGLQIEIGKDYNNFEK